MAAIEIFLIHDDVPKSFLLIPHRAIQRLAVRPFKWLRYVTFTVCGARGNLATTPEGPNVDYDRTEITDADTQCYYRPSENYSFIDNEGLNDRLTSSEKTRRRGGFRSDVIQRDGPYCVVTQIREEDCEAAHLIPRSKGVEYILRVLRLRSAGDDSPPPEGIQRDDMRNAIFLRKDLHSMLGRGAVAFIKTPNYGLAPEDISRFQRGDPRPDYLTLHWMEEPEDYDPTALAYLQTLQAGSVNPRVALFLLHSLFRAGANFDALFQGDGVSLPSTIILDYAYGLAAYNAWKSKRDGDFEAMKQYREAHYKNITPVPSADPDEDELDEPDPPDDPKDGTYDPQQSRKRSTRKRRRDENESDLTKTIDELNMHIMHILGTTPEEAAKRRQNEIEQEERAAQEVSRSKVMEWINAQDVH